MGLKSVLELVFSLEQRLRFLADSVKEAADGVLKLGAYKDCRARWRRTLRPSRCQKRSSMRKTTCTLRSLHASEAPGKTAQAWGMGIRFQRLMDAGWQRSRRVQRVHNRPITATLVVTSSEDASVEWS